MSVKRKLIAKGTETNIFLDDGFVYKEYLEDYPVDWIEYEVVIQQEVLQKTSLLIPNVVFLRDTKEIKIDYIEGYTLGERMRNEKYKEALDDLIDIQLSIHQYGGLKLQQSHEVFEKQILASTLDEDLKNIAIASLKHVVLKQNLCHFDMHFLNIIYNGSDYYIIDWMNAKLGNPVMDVARTYIILKQYAQRLANKYLKLIVKRGNYTMSEIETAIPLMAVLRLLENDAIPFKNKLLELIQSY